MRSSGVCGCFGLDFVLGAAGETGGGNVLLGVWRQLDSLTPQQLQGWVHTDLLLLDSLVVEFLKGVVIGVAEHVALTILVCIVNVGVSSEDAVEAARDGNRDGLALLLVVLFEFLILEVAIICFI